MLPSGAGLAAEGTLGRRRPHRLAAFGVVARERVTPSRRYTARRPATTGAESERACVNVRSGSQRLRSRRKTSIVAGPVFTATRPFPQAPVAGGRPRRAVARACMLPLARSSATRLRRPPGSRPCTITQSPETSGSPSNASGPKLHATVGCESTGATATCPERVPEPPAWVQTGERASPPRDAASARQRAASTRRLSARELGE
jgi:hypothetical protein